MKKKKWLLLTVLIIGILPASVFGDCLSLARYTSWYAEPGNTIIFYSGRRPMAVVELAECTVTPASTVRLVKNYICDSDMLIVDGEECRIMTVSSTASSSF